MEDITAFYDEESSENGLTLNDLMAWEDIKELIADGELKESDVQVDLLPSILLAAHIIIHNLRTLFLSAEFMGGSTKAENR